MGGRRGREKVRGREEEEANIEPRTPNIERRSEEEEVWRGAVGVSPGRAGG
jgi:hypothetical protein